MFFLKVIRSRFFFLKLVLVLILLYLFWFMFDKINYARDLKENNNISESKKEEPQKNNSKYQKNHNIVENTELNIENLNFKSRTNKNKEYNIVADRAEKNFLGEYVLSNVNTIIHEDLGDIKLLSENGFFNEESGLLILKGDILALYQNYKIKSDFLEISLKNESLTSPEKVEVFGNNWKVSSDSMKVENDKIIEFDGNVKTYFYPD